MKIIDFANTSNWKNGEQTTFLGNDNDGSSGGGTYLNSSPGILSARLGTDGYPTVTSGSHAGESLANLYRAGDLQEVNHLFIESTYHTSGYFVFDSSQNFAKLDKSTGNFTVYQELGTHDDKSSASVKHGQFFPFNSIDPNVISSKNPENLYDTLGNQLADSNPRKYENLYKISNPDYQFGVELETSFVQTPNGLDDWGHDIIYEFTGDDDFWLYVDGELVIDLGGVHSALFGSINYATGEIQVQNNSGQIRHLTLYEVFEQNYRNSGDYTDEQVQEYLDGIFQLNSKGQHVFRDYTSHTMRIFYMERGKGASNLQMRFNQSSVKPKTVILSKELAGVEHPEKFNAEFPYQIFYRKTEDQVNYFRLTPSSADISVVYRGTDTDVKYAEEYTTDDGVVYSNVFFLEPGEACEIKLPDEAIDYYIVECGVDPYVFNEVKANETVLTGTPVAGSDREDYGIVAAKAKDRTSVEFVNTVNEDALRVLTFTKKLWNENSIGENNELFDDDTPFNFRLYLATEHETDNEVKLANMYTYQVKDRQGVYCRWDSTQKKFVPIRNVTNYQDLTTAEKKQASFTTSMNGSISKIPAFYTVEVRELLAGAKYMVQERYNEMPDGYSRIRYDIYNNYTGASTDAWHPEEGDVVNAIIKDQDPHVDIHNIRGYGIRIYKEWTDTDFVTERDNTYFAVYKHTGSGDVLIPDSIYMLKYKKNTLYWYYKTLDTGLTLDDYIVKEVVLADAVTDANGKVTSYSSITPLADGQEFTLNGKLKGETSNSASTYKVMYDNAPQKPTRNMRIETIVNKRDGIAIYKKDNEGNPIAGAKFELREKATKTLIGTFESGSDGFVSYAYLRKNVEYTLEEVKSPASYTGLKNPLTVVMGNDGSITVTADPSTSAIDNDRFTVDPGPDDPSITVINLHYDFTISKKDKSTHEPVAGVVFELHKQKTVGGITVVDFQAMDGYEHLETGADGVVPGINSSLAPGTYELREVSTPSTHQGLNYYILFTVTQTGDIRLNDVHPEVEVEEQIEADRVIYTLLIYNNPVVSDLSITKQVAGNLGSKTEVFPMTVTLTDSSNNPYIGSFSIKKNSGAEEQINLQAVNNGEVHISLSHNDTVVFMGLDEHTRFSVTETDLKGYKSKGYIGGTLKSDTGTVSGNTDTDHVVVFVNTREGVIPTGMDLSYKVSVAILCAMSAVVIFNTCLRMRRREDEE